MFERDTEKARRTVFFARYEASEFGSPAIETEHLLLGFLRENKALANRFLSSDNSVAAIRQRIRALTPVREKISTSVDLPLSHESARVLAYSAEEAEKLKQVFIGPEHMLLGLLREEKSLAANLLQERGLSIERVREDLAAGGADSPVSPGNALQTRLLKYLESQHSELGVSAAGPHIYVSLPSTAPFLLIEILSPTDRFTEVRQAIDEHLAVGLRYVWLFDPGTGHVYTAMPGAGLHEFKGDVLSTKDPILELPLAAVFA
jgi:Clp amino terminal domain, pathogenicity island component/Putative restriction endonuclease